ncbi:MAG: PocR ligand-binding domain-containing protein [Eubacteriales bacterium]|nr:PocR ligand-binding domain-containing protein [Eubacteriales bacterium]
MISTFNLSKLVDLFKDFYRLTQIRITVFDDSFHELASYPEEVSPVCQIIRTDRNALHHCNLCDQQACDIASRRRSAYIYRCHAGLTESIVPVYLGNIVIGYLLFGHLLSYPSYGEAVRSITQCCREYRIDLEELRKQCLLQPLIQEDYIHSAAQIMRTVASYLCLERIAILKNEELPARLDEYITRHFTEELNTAVLCDHFRIGKTQLCEMAKQMYGIGIAQQIRLLRINRAKELLSKDPELSISDIAAACGFHDYNYFITLFKRMTGMTPRQYARASRSEYPRSLQRPT